MMRVEFTKSAHGVIWNHAGADVIKKEAPVLDSIHHLIQLKNCEKASRVTLSQCHTAGNASNIFAARILCYIEFRMNRFYCLVQGGYVSTHDLFLCLVGQPTLKNVEH